VNRLAGAFSSTRSQRFSTERVAGIAAVAVIHAAFLYAFVTGMAQNFVRNVPHILEVTFPPHTEQLERLPPPPLPNVEVAAVPEVAPPVIRIARPAETRSITVREAPSQAVPTAPTRPAQPAEPAPAPAPVVAPTPAVGIVATHTTPPYPTIARKLGEQGTVRLGIALDERGAVTDVSVVRSSGHSRLDEAAVNWVKAHWRYRPATRNGAPVPANTMADIVFDLRTRR
jgi:protein TonB